MRLKVQMVIYEHCRLEDFSNVMGDVQPCDLSSASCRDAPSSATYCRSTPHVRCLSYIIVQELNELLFTLALCDCQSL